RHTRSGGNRSRGRHHPSTRPVGAGPRFGVPRLDRYTARLCAAIRAAGDRLHAAWDRQIRAGERVIPILLVILFAAAAWLAHEAWTSPVEDEMPAQRRRRVEEFLHRAGLHEVTPREFVLFSVGSGALSGTFAHLLMAWPLVSVVATAVGATGPYLLH